MCLTHTHRHKLTHTQSEFGYIHEATRLEPLLLAKKKQRHSRWDNMVHSYGGSECVGCLWHFGSTHFIAVAVNYVAHDA